MKRIFFLLSIIPFFVNTANGQELISSSGDYYETSELSLEWSIGEIMTETFTEGSLILTQGLHQSYFTITALDELPPTLSNISVYPNPATQYFYINTSQTDLKYTITDIAGKIIAQDNVNGKTKVNISNYTNNIYFLNIIEKDNTSKKTFKIIKQ